MTRTAKEQLLDDLRKWRADRELWVWLGTGAAAWLGGMWLWQHLLPELAGMLAWIATTAVWLVAAHVRLALRNGRREDRANDFLFELTLPVWVTAETEDASGGRWYQVTLFDCSIGRIEHCPDAPFDRRWMAWTNNEGAPSGGGHFSKRAACEALVRRSVNRP